MYNLEYYRRKGDRKWGWRAREIHTKDIVATDGGQGYNNFDDMHRVAMKVLNPDSFNNMVVTSTMVEVEDDDFPVAVVMQTGDVSPHIEETEIDTSGTEVKSAD